jgi:tetratricopeptide (TPR) repeat protein
MTEFLAELRRRRVLPMAGAYTAIAWLATEIASFLLAQAGAPSWTLRLLAIVFVVGFPLAVTLAWVIQVGPDGKRHVDRSAGQGKIVGVAIVLGIFVMAGLSWLILPRIDNAEGDSTYDPLPNSLAVLPLTTTDGTPNEQTVAETLYNVLLDGLDQSRELTQIQLRTEHRPDDLVAFGREFRVGALLVGNIMRRSGKTLIEMQLLDVGPDQVRWSDTIEWEPTRIMEIGAAISDAVLRALSLPAIQRMQFVGTESREAYEAYLLGKKHFDVMNAKNMAIAVDYFEKAVALDPGYVRGHARLATSYLLNGYFAAKTPAEREEWTAKARVSANRAIELDPDSPDAISILGRLADNAELKAQLFQRALELEPNHGPSLFRYALSVLRPAERLDEAADLLQRLLDIDPLDANRRHEYARTLMDLGRKEEAIAQLERAVELQPEMTQNYHMLGYWMVFDFGRLDEAILWHRKAYAVNPETGFQAAPVAQSYAALGMRKEALRFIEKALEWLEWEPPVLFMAGHTHERLGDPDTALGYWKRFVETTPDKDHEEMPAILIDIDLNEGRYVEALQRFRETYPDLVSIDAEPGYSMFWYARLLEAAGYEEDARLRFEKVAAHLESACAEDLDEFSCRYLPWQVYAELGDRRKTLDWLRFSLEDRPYFANNQNFDHESLDFLREDAEFRELMDYVDAEMDKQRARIRQLECDGEMPPAPAIDTSDFCY